MRHTLVLIALIVTLTPFVHPVDLTKQAVAAISFRVVIGHGVLIRASLLLELPR